jgi:hypothetical protein
VLDFLTYVRRREVFDTTRTHSLTYYSLTHALISRSSYSSCCCHFFSHTNSFHTLTLTHFLQHNNTIFNYSPLTHHSPLNHSVTHSLTHSSCPPQHPTTQTMMEISSKITIISVFPDEAARSRKRSLACSQSSRSFRWEREPRATSYCQA